MAALVVRGRDEYITSAGPSQRDKLLLHRSLPA